MDTLTTFYYTDAQGQPIGPMTARQLMDAKKSGLITADTLVNRSGGDEWLRFSSWADLMPKDGPDPSVSAPKDDVRIVEPVSKNYVLGVLFFIVGLILMLYFSCWYSITIGSGGITQVHNLGLISNRHAGISVGGFLFVAGSVYIAASGKFRIRPRNPQ